MLDLCMFAEATTNQEELVAVGDEGKVEAFLPSQELRVGRREDGWLSARSQIVTDDAGHLRGVPPRLQLSRARRLPRRHPLGLAPAVSLEDGLLSVAVGVAAHRSIDERRPVDLAEVLAP